MSKISDLIFRNQSHYISSPYGNRTVINTAAGVTSSFHSGTDYATYNKKLPQYAIEDGYVFAASKELDGALYVWVIYPRVKLAMLHYHLDSYNVRAGQTVVPGTLLGYTGMTGKTTGIHLHLGIKNLSSLSESAVKSMTWDLLRKYSYTDPEKVKYEPKSATAKSSANSSFLPSRGYFMKGDVSANVGKIASFFRKVFPSYTDVRALGNTYGPYIISAVKEFQKRTGLVADGFFGIKTLNKLKQYGFKE